MTCELSVFSLSGSPSVDIDFGDGTNQNLLMNTQIRNIKIDKEYLETGTYLINVSISSKKLVLNQIVQIHGFIFDYLIIFIFQLKRLKLLFSERILIDRSYAYCSRIYPYSYSFQDFNLTNLSCALECLNRNFTYSGISIKSC